MSRKESSENRPWIAIIVAVLALIGTGLTAYFSYKAAKAPIELSIRATQTAEARLTLTPTDTPVPPTDTPAPPTTPTPVPPTDTPAPIPPTPMPVPPTDTPTPSAPPGMVYVPAGEFIMGSTEAEVENARKLCDEDHGGCERDEFKHEKDQHKVDLGAFYIDKYEVTNAQYRKCVEVEECEMPAPCLEGEPTYGDTSKEDHPVVCVDWYQADIYCRWARKRLPTEAEWEKAARGTDGWMYPWKGEIDCNHAQYRGCGGQTVPVGSKEEGASPYGAMDMAGNVWEWTASLWGEALSEPEFKYPYYPDDGREDLHAPTAVLRVFRGGSWKRTRSLARCAYRHRGGPGLRIDDVGFRCARSSQ